MCKYEAITCRYCNNGWQISFVPEYNTAALSDVHLHSSRTEKPLQKELQPDLSSSEQCDGSMSHLSSPRSGSSCSSQISVFSLKHRTFLKAMAQQFYLLFLINLLCLFKNNILNYWCPNLFLFKLT